jgi:hydrogenase/urease accessory protein HupE
MSGFAGGLLHPLAVPAHALALLALGLLIGQQGAGRMLVPLAGFAVGMAAGLAAIILAVRQTSAADVVLAATALAGALVVLARPLPGFACAVLAAIAGVALGLDSPPQAISIALGTLMLIGTGLGACLALAMVAAGTARFARAWQRIGVRIVGSWIAASAILVLALRFARGQLF